MKSTLEIVAGSWPIAVMFIATLTACFGFYLAHWRKKSDEQDKAYRSNQAMVVRNTND